ncbi:hypothetical protein IFM89_024576 [Coptis chinensis]|uniref:Reverse transcriptase domain-containing protein n=1 Tax=Coptis chinensis TaxID=261450 RepID=A0A835I3R9_9MAGN|nr:hypothetical protein IFM89_024576 [Coptis chinensis]
MGKLVRSEEVEGAVKEVFFDATEPQVANDTMDVDKEVSSNTLAMGSTYGDHENSNNTSPQQDAIERNNAVMSTPPCGVPNLRLLWRNDVLAPTLHSQSSQHITVESPNGLITIIHASSIGPIGCFTAERGLRQRDPLSPILFAFAEDCLSKGLEWLCVNRKIQRMVIQSNYSSPTHLMFADDIFIF